MDCQDKLENITIKMKEAKNVLRQQDEFLQNLTSDGLLHSTIVGHNDDDDTVTISRNNELFEVHNPNTKFEIGDGCLILPTTNQIVKVFEKPNKQRFLLQETPNVTWDDIGGHDEIKKEIRDSIELPSIYKNLYQKFNIHPPKGILLHGAPGCGKTMIGKAIANALSQNEGYFFYVRGSEMLQMYVGMAEQMIRNLFSESRKIYKKTGKQVVIFIDEADGILKARGMGISSDIQDTIIPTFLSELDGLEESSALFLLSTNREDILDPAITRDGRIDTIINIPRPTESELDSIFKLYLGKRFEKLSTKTAKTIFQNDDEFCYYSILDTSGNTKIFSLKDIISGSMARNIVHRAKRISLSRSIESNKNYNLTHKDLQKSIRVIYNQNKTTCHGFLEDFIKNEKIQTKKIYVK